MISEGVKIGALTILEQAKPKISFRGDVKLYSPTYWVRCNCGLIFKAEQYLMEAGEVTSCGCDGLTESFYKDAHEGDYDGL